MTADHIVARIKEKLAEQKINWRAQTVDTFKAGRPDTDVRGIATTGMATLDVLRRAAKAGRNFVIAHEPTFYNHQDETSALEHDATYKAKQRFIADNQMIVWRFHDHAHALRPDPLVAGSARALGWSKYATAANPRLHVIPETTLRDLAGDVARQLKGHAIRVAGDPAMKVSRIMLGPGWGVPALGPDFDVAVGGEMPEAGGNTEYALDAIALGGHKGVIVLGHMLSEDFGMKEVRDWLQTFLTEVPVSWIPAGEPFSPLG
jgi:putative NIF3 family GTP cyclohydrolase 1 type 2